MNNAFVKCCLCKKTGHKYLNAVGLGITVVGFLMARISDAVLTYCNEKKYLVPQKGITRSAAESLPCAR
jgi:hypothetical protein